MNDQERAELAALVCDECWGSGLTTVICPTCGGTGEPRPVTTSTSDSAQTIILTFDVSEARP